MTWWLVVMMVRFGSPGGVAIDHIRFTNKSACEVAGQDIILAKPEIPVEITFTCVLSQ